MQPQLRQKLGEKPERALTVVAKQIEETNREAKNTHKAEKEREKLEEELREILNDKDEQVFKKSKLLRRYKKEVEKHIEKIIS